MFELLCDNDIDVLNDLGLGSFLLSFLLDLHCASFSSLELLAGESGHHGRRKYISLKDERLRKKTYTNQSTVQRRDTSCTGASIAVRTMIMRTRAALGREALATLAAVEVSLEREN